MAEKKVVQETLKRLRKPYVKYDRVVRPSWEKNGASPAVAAPVVYGYGCQ